MQELQQSPIEEPASWLSSQNSTQDCNLPLYPIKQDASEHSGVKNMRFIFPSVKEAFAEILNSSRKKKESEIKSRKIALRTSGLKWGLFSQVERVFKLGWNDS